MAQAEATQEALTTADGTPLKVSLRRALRRNTIGALLLVSPLFLFILFSFLIPIFDMLSRSIDNEVMENSMPLTMVALADWDGENLPDEAVFEAMVRDLQIGRENRSIGRAATRMNYAVPGMRGLIMGSARRAGRIGEGPYREALIEVDEDWGEIDTWRAFQQNSSPTTLGYYLNAVDLKFDLGGSVVAQPETRQIYVNLFWRTLWMSCLITVLTIALGFPIAYLLATLPTKSSNLLMILVLLPFWTSLLVRTTAWIVMLQSEGVINDLAVWVGLYDDGNRAQLIHNRTGTIIAMTHILLPFMVLPLYSVMKTIPPTYMRAARSLGASQMLAYWRVYVPQTVPGIGAGSILVFILAIGYYITPALVGGTSGTLISNQIAYHMQSSLNWGLAAALGAILLALVLLLFAIYDRIVGIDNMKLG